MISKCVMFYAVEPFVEEKKQKRENSQDKIYS